MPDIHLTAAFAGGHADLRTPALQNAFIDVLPAQFEAAGWTLQQTYYAFSVLNIIALVERRGPFERILVVEGKLYRVYNPAEGDSTEPEYDTFQSGSTLYPVVNVPVAVGAVAANIASLASAIAANSTFTASVEAPENPFYDGAIRLISTIAGGAGNDHEVVGAGHTIAQTQPIYGGYRYRSALANGKSYVELRWWRGDHGFTIFPSLFPGDGVSSTEQVRRGFPFYSVSRYIYTIDPYQFLMCAQENHSPAELGDPAGLGQGGYSFLLSAPHVPYGRDLDYCAFSFPIVRSAMYQQIDLQLAIDTGYRFGNYTAGETGWSIYSLYGDGEMDLLTSNDKPLILSPFIGAAVLDNTERRLIGLTWNSFVTIREDALDSIHEVKTEGVDHKYIALMNSSTTGSQNSTLYWRVPLDFKYLAD